MADLFYRPLMPSCQSFSGYMLDGMVGHLDTIDPDFEPNFSARAEVIKQRALAALHLLLTATVDLAWWVGMTITLYPMHQTGYKNHLLNLVSTVAMYGFFLPMLFGIVPKVDHGRFFCKVGNAALRDEPPRRFYNTYFSESHPDYVKEQLAFDPQAGELFAQQRAEMVNNIAREGFSSTFHIWGVQHGMSHGLNLNTTRDELRRTWPMHAAAQPLLIDAHTAIEKIFDIHRQLPSCFQYQIDLDLEDNEGFDALTFALTGVHFTTLHLGSVPGLAPPFWIPEPVLANGNSLSYDVEPTQHRETPGMPVVSILLRKGAMIKETRFEEYRDFVQQICNRLTENPGSFPAQATALQSLREAHKNSPNRYIRLVATHILPKFVPENLFPPQQSTIPQLLENANALVAQKQEILNLWWPRYMQYKHSMPDVLKNTEKAILHLIEEYFLGPGVRENFHRQLA